MSLPGVSNPVRERELVPNDHEILWHLSATGNAYRSPTCHAPRRGRCCALVSEVRKFTCQVTYCVRTRFVHEQKCAFPHLQGLQMDTNCRWSTPAVHLAGQPGTCQADSRKQKHQTSGSEHREARVQLAVRHMCDSEDCARARAARAATLCGRVRMQHVAEPCLEREVKLSLQMKL